MRKIIDSVVERNRVRDIESYNKFGSLPIYYGEVQSTNNELKLEGTPSKEKLSAIGVMLATNFIAEEGSSGGTVKIRGKKFDISESRFAAIRSAILSTVTNSDAIGTGFSAAINDWLDSSFDNKVNPLDHDNVHDRLWQYAYNAMLDTLLVALDTGELNVSNIIEKMKG